jgi:hypothetical protein
MYSINKTPWAIPTTLTSWGIAQIYFKGIAIKRSTINDIASRELIILKTLMPFFKPTIFYKYSCQIST